MPSLSQIKRWLWEPEPPGVGVEFRTDEIIVARFGDNGRGEMDLCLRAPLPPGVVDFSMLTPNLNETEALGSFLGKLFDEAGIQGNRVGLTLPDILAHVSVQELPETPRSRVEAEELLRFRLKKALPFEVSEARLAFQAVRGTNPSFLTGILHEEVARQYETLFDGLGLHAGVIETSSLSLLKLWEGVVVESLTPEQDYLFLNLEETYFTLTLVRDRNQPVLMRTVGHRSPLADAAGPEKVATYQVESLLRELVPTLIYYKEKLGGDSLARVYYRSLRHDLGDLTELLEDQFDVPAEPFDLHRAVTVGDQLTVAEPLASAAGAASGVARGKAA